MSFNFDIHSIQCLLTFSVTWISHTHKYIYTHIRQVAYSLCSGCLLIFVICSVDLFEVQKSRLIFLKMKLKSLCNNKEWYRIFEQHIMYFQQVWHIASSSYQNPCSSSHEYHIFWQNPPYCTLVHAMSHIRITLYLSLSLPLTTIRHICNPHFCPAFFQAFSCCADSSVEMKTRNTVCIYTLHDIIIK